MPKKFSTAQDTALFLLRLVLAAIFAYAGWAKIPFWSSAPEGIGTGMLWITRITSIAEPLGALALLIGYLTRRAAGGLAVVMIGAIWIMQAKYHIGFVTDTGAGWNFPLALLAGCLVLVAFGPGRWSVRSAG